MDSVYSLENFLKMLYLDANIPLTFTAVKKIKSYTHSRSNPLLHIRRRNISAGFGKIPTRSPICLQNTASITDV